MMGKTVTSHPALIYDNVEKDCLHYTPDHCNFVAVFLGSPGFAVERTERLFLGLPNETGSTMSVLPAAAVVLLTNNRPADPPCTRV